MSNVKKVGRGGHLLDREDGGWMNVSGGKQNQKS